MLNILLILRLSFLPGVDADYFCRQTGNDEMKLLYAECRLDSVLSFDIFKLALTGMEKITGIQNKKLITIIDFSKSSDVERFFVIDLENKKTLFRTLVAHGRNSGEEKAESFSNDAESLKSCLGFFLTAETYYGKHGYSLSLDGLESGINDNARTRLIVIHGAEYVSRDYIKKYGRLGRSWGCPALPSSISKDVIDKISGGTCLFIYGNDPDYLWKSKILN
jgi:hypothetical protein